jgi:hypothetical protein
MTREELNKALTTVEYVDPGAGTVVAAPEPADYIWIEDDVPAGAKLEGNSPWEFVTAPDHPVHAGTKSTRRQGRRHESALLHRRRADVEDW